MAGREKLNYGTFLCPAKETQTLCYSGWRPDERFYTMNKFVF